MSDKEFTNASFNQFLNDKRLMASRCKKCGELYLPPLPLCRKCGGREIEWVEMSGKGKLAAFTCVAVAPTFMVQEGYGRDKPYCSGIVQLKEGPKISGRILGVDPQQPEKIAVGTPATAEYIERGQGEEKKTYLGFRLSG